MSQTFDFSQVGRLPLQGDNVAIAVQRLEAGCAVRYGDETFQLDYTVMEGHRFAVNRIERGDTLRSWGLPFGRALHDIDPGSYLCNAGMLEALGGRTIDFALPPAANFADHIQPLSLIHI